MRRALCNVYCFATDWMSALYYPDAPRPLPWIGEKLQVLWFKTHHNRFYEWLDRG